MEQDRVTPEPREPVEETAGAPAPPPAAEDPTVDRATEEAPAADRATEEAPAAEPAARSAPRVHDKRRRGEPSVEEQLERARKEAAEHLDDLRRLKAEFENYRKRVLKEQTQVVERASERLIERLLPVLDNFELALLAADRTKDYEALVKGVEMVFGELMELLHREGLQKIDALGKPFDPALHEAVLEVGEGPADGDAYVAEVLRNGYTLKGRVIRPAMVKVVRR
jgi:molecular chaperone GrpE